MQVGSVNVSPESANHMIVSLNGVIQKPNSSYTVAGAVITFSSALVTGDVINFIQILGSVLDLGVPSDDTVSTAKLQNDSVTTDKLANSINSAITANTAKTGITSSQASAIIANTAKVTNATHSGDVTGATALTIADNAVTLAKMASGTDGNIISYDTSGNPVAVATGSSGQILTSAGAGAVPSFQTPSGGGIENIKTFNMTSNFTMGAEADITANWSAVGDSLGTAVSESSGIFTFPQTGFYLVSATFNMSRIGESKYIGIRIKRTTNNSSYSTIAEHYIFIPNVSNVFGSLYAETIVDVTNTSNVKVKLAYESESANNITMLGTSSAVDNTYIRFIRLAAT
jgi:hypothetical protein